MKTNSWSNRTIGELCKFSSGYGFRPSDWSKEGLPIIRIQNLNGSKEFNYFSGIPDDAWLVESGTILFAWAGVRGVSFGPTIWSGPRGVLNQHIYRVHPYGGINPLWLYLALEAATKNIEQSAHGFKATLLHVRKEDITNQIIPFPPLAEQHAIATALSDVDALIASLDKLIAKKRDIKQATMQQLLTGKTRLPGFSKGVKQKYKQTEMGNFPEDWSISFVENIADVKNGKRDTQDRMESGLYPFFVRSQIVERIDSYSYDGEAVLTAGDGVGVGKVFHYANEKFDFHQRVYMIYNFRNCDGFFLYLYFSNNFYKETTKYSAKNSVDSVRREMITRMQIPHPSLPEQHAIATVISDMDAEIVALEQKRDKTRALKQGMMQELLTGKTRLL